jgi:hypothetical protein
MGKTGLVFLSAWTLIGAADPLVNLPADSWYSHSGTKLRNALYPGTDMGDPATLIDAWNGGAFDSKRSRLIIWGGGLGNYKGNELYAFRMDSLKWTRLTDPCLQFGCSEPDACGSPIVRHTYNGIAYLAHADRLFVHGGAYNCEGKGCALRDTWTFDMASGTSGKWQRMEPKGDIPSGGTCGNHCAYDPLSKKVFYADDAGLYAYAYDANAWEHLDDHGSYYQTAALDTKRGLLLQIGSGSVMAYDIRKAKPVREEWKTTGGGPVVEAGNPGAEYDPVSDRVIAWAEGAAYALNPETRTWTAMASSGAPKPGPNGIYGRWRYDAGRNVFVTVTSIDDDVHFFKATGGAGTALAPGFRAPTAAARLKGKGKGEGRNAAGRLHAGRTPGFAKGKP